MKILWITNILLPGACAELGVQIPVVGGWMQASALTLLNQKDIQLAVATVYVGKELKTFTHDRITYYLLPSQKDNTRYNKHLESYWQQIKNSFNPDIVHIHGTEYAHGLAYIRACSSQNVVVSIQGLVSVCHRYYTAGMSFTEILKNITFRDIVRKDTIWQQKAKFYQRGLVEKEYIQTVKHFIGRTSWDKSHVMSMNPQINYHFCNETLRDKFYKYRWNYTTCKKHTIFLSQASYPIKGLHIMLKALPLILQKYPDTNIYIAGNDITYRSTFLARIKQNGYAKYISKLIKKLQIANHIIFTGELNEQQMCQQYLKANVFVCPSSIENSPNSLGEAQLLGVPCVASYVGGIPNMIFDKQCGLMYRFEEVEMLAQLVIHSFATTYTSEMSNIKCQTAEIRHNKQKNMEALICIYKTISEEQVSLESKNDILSVQE